MGIYVKNGTPVNTESLCESCSRAFIARGYGETELVAICQALWPERRMHFPRRTCTAYIEKNKPTFKNETRVLSASMNPRTAVRKSSSSWTKTHNDISPVAKDTDTSMT